MCIACLNIAAISEGASQANTLEMLSARTEDSKSYTGYDGRSLEDYPDGYGPYGVCNMDKFLRTRDTPCQGSP